MGQMVCIEKKPITYHFEEVSSFNNFTYKTEYFNQMKSHAEDSYIEMDRIRFARIKEVDKPAMFPFCNLLY